MTEFTNDRNSVVLPTDVFIELQEAAWNQTPATTSERVGQTLQTTAMVAGVGAVFVAATWGWAKANDWLEHRRFQRNVAKAENQQDPYTEN